METDKIRALESKAQTFLRSAAVLLELEDFDSCASRAYFAMFFSVQALLLHETASLPSKQGIRTAFLERYVDSGRLPSRAGEALQRAADLQELGDYGYGHAVSQPDAEYVLQEAEAFVNSLARLIEVSA